MVSEFKYKNKTHISTLNTGITKNTDKNPSKNF